MCIQTESELPRGVCFSPFKHKELNRKTGDLKSPLKVRNFDKQSANTVLMCSNVAVNTIDDIDFQPNEIPSINNVNIISAINTSHVIAIKAKLLQQRDKEKGKSDNRENFFVSVFFGHPLGTIKITLWQPFSDFQEAQTYDFDNPLGTREYNTKHNLSNTKNWVQSCRNCFVQGQCDSTL